MRAISPSTCSASTERGSAASTVSSSVASTPALLAASSLASAIFGAAALGSSRIASCSSVWALTLSVQTRRGHAERRAHLAFESRRTVAGTDQVGKIGELALAQQRRAQHRQVVGLGAVALARRARLAFSRNRVAELQVDAGEAGAQLGVLRRVAHRVAQLDFGCFEVAFGDILVGVLDRGRRIRGISQRSGGDQRRYPERGAKM